MGQAATETQTVSARTSTQSGHESWVQRLLLTVPNLRLRDLRFCLRGWRCKQARKLHERDWLAPAGSVREATGDAPTCCTTVDCLIREFEENKFDAVFLDHDLCWEDAAYSEQTLLSSD